MPPNSTEYREHFYRSADDRLNLYARIYSGVGPTLLMMHGLTRNSADFEPLIHALDDTFHIISVDQRGRGRSEYDPDPSNYIPQAYVDDMFALLDELEIEKVTLVGTSMGGLMAMMMAAVQKERISGIIINDIGPEVDQAGVTRIQGYVGQSKLATSWEDAAQMCKDINGYAFPSNNAGDWLDFARRTFVQQKNGLMRLAYDPAIAKSIEGDQPSTVPPNLWPVWDSLSDIPLLVVRGAISDILTDKSVEKMEQRHKGFFARVDVPNVGHAPVLDEPEALTAIKSFLKDRAR